MKKKEKRTGRKNPKERAKIYSCITAETKNTERAAIPLFVTCYQMNKNCQIVLEIRYFTLRLVSNM